MIGNAAQLVIGKRRDASAQWRLPKRVSFVFSLISLLGLVVAFAIHIESLLGMASSGALKSVWVIQIALLFLLLPPIAELFSSRSPAQILESPRWMQIALYVLLAYYGLHFYVFLYWSSDHLSSEATWRMFSAGWLLLFAIVCVFYRVRSTELS